ncbi:MAG: alanine racemase [Gammaproteobacteria bacterium]|nr:alanine racemase [Gammaproteobacteria bacterium]
MSRPAQITINLAALRHNLQQVRQMAVGSAILAMVKSNAYGHGLERIALALPDADAFGVASLEEGMHLRHAGVTNPIFLMEGLFDASELPEATANDFTLIVHHMHQVEMLEAHPNLKPFNIWLKIDTGMHRLGFRPTETLAIYERLMQCAAVRKPIGLMTHFAQADSVDRAHTLQQIELFNSVTEGLVGPRSLSNSAGVIAWPSAHRDLVRPGITLYGASPLAGHRGVEHHLYPVMTLSSQLIAVHDVAKDSRVGYGGTWTCPEDMRIGVVGIGYGDGYPLHAKNGTPVFVNGRPCPLAGRVAMDMITVDLRTQPNAAVGDPVLLWGPGLPVEVVAGYSETTAYELLTRITQRVRVVVKNDEPISFGTPINSDM